MGSSVYIDSEACDSSCILDISCRQCIASYPNVESFLVNSLSDIDLVERPMVIDKYLSFYNY